MFLFRSAACALLAGWALLAAGPPPLQPGEAIALARGEGGLLAQGEAQAPAALGDLAVLPWLRLEGFNWSSRGESYVCKGKDGALACTLAKGHGRVDLSKALERNCRLAILAWVRRSMAERSRSEGEDVARLRLDEVFAPFLRARLAASPVLPAFGPEWTGEGDLLRASPAFLATWLADPGQEAHLGMIQRLGSGIFEGEIGRSEGWTYVGHALAGAQDWTWVVWGRGSTIAVLRLQGSLDRKAAQARARQLLAAPAAGTAAKP